MKYRLVILLVLVIYVCIGIATRENNNVMGPSEKINFEIKLVLIYLFKFVSFVHIVCNTFIYLLSFFLCQGMLLMNTVKQFPGKLTFSNTYLICKKFYFNFLQANSYKTWQKVNFIFYVQNMHRNLIIARSTQ